MQIDEIRKLISYNRRTGEFTWKKRGEPSFDARFAGEKAGTTHISGRGRKSVAIKIGGKKYYAHILAWALVHGSWPTHEVDHIDHDTFNNRLSNLRHVTNVENKKNLPKSGSNTSGTTGVVWHTTTKRWRAVITVDKKRHYLGSFTRKSDAIQARKQANTQFGFHANHGK